MSSNSNNLLQSSEIQNHYLSQRLEIEDLRSKKKHLKLKVQSFKDFLKSKDQFDFLRNNENKIKINFQNNKFIWIKPKEKIIKIYKLYYKKYFGVYISKLMNSNNIFLDSDQTLEFYNIINGSEIRFYNVNLITRNHLSIDTSLKLKEFLKIFKYQNNFSFPLENLNNLDNESLISNNLENISEILETLTIFKKINIYSQFGLFESRNIHVKESLFSFYQLLKHDLNFLIPKEGLFFKYNGIIIQKNIPIQYYNIPNDAIIKIQLALDHRIFLNQGDCEIRVNAYGGNIYYIKVFLTDNISILNKKNYFKTGFEPQMMRFVYNGRRLENGFTFNDYGINQNSEIFGQFIIRG